MESAAMDEKQSIFSEKKKTKLWWVIFFCALGVAINMFGSYVVIKLHLPVFLDTFGTVLVAALGGYLPGVVVGLATNLLKCALDPTSIYYGVINIYVAVCVAFFMQRGFFQKIHKIILSVFVLSIVSGGASAVLTWFLYGFSADSISVPFFVSLYEKGRIGAFPTELFADILVDTVDKAIIVLLLVFVLKILPEHVKEDFYLSGWQQRPLSGWMTVAARNIKCRSISLRTKILLLLAVASLLVGLVATVICYMLFKSSTTEEHELLAEGVAKLAADAVDAERVDEYIEKGEAAEGYKETEDWLYKIRESSLDIQYIYVYKIMEDGCHVVFDLDTGSGPGAEPGELIAFDDAFSEYLPKLLAGEEIEPVVSDETYGWLLTVYKPVYDKNGKCRCYAAADVSMAKLVHNQRIFFVRLTSICLGFFILILIVGLWFAEYNIILPVNTMAMSASSFANNSEEARNQNVERIKKLDIHTSDEVENLYHAFLRMTEDTVRYVEDIQHKTEIISKMQNGLILVLADMVESRDQCTGDHVRKTAAYTEIIMREMKKKGYYADELTDAFISDVVNSAPLHDIGKIQVSDAILNKPGKLTDEEFDIMKSHTTAGQEILANVIATVPDSAGYLAEAKNLAAYHHEKWNGKGYPTGLAGENIPLSARIMAVADVFDALVSRRSYKKPFPFDKAMGIIKEDAGTHFDPLVADAFLGARDEVRRVAEEFEGPLE